MKILITGTAGFIGFHLAQKLINEGHEIIGLDSINDYYDVNLKYGRLEYSGVFKSEIDYNKIAQSRKYDNYSFIQLNLEDRQNLINLFENEKPEYVVNLAAQAGVRYSLENPYAYVDSNIIGFVNILECCRHYQVKHLIYASSSSVYGLNKQQPFSTEDNIDHPISLYAASKKSNELMAHTYSHLFGLPTTGLRFFTVYGPWGRPDMALFIFTKAIIENKPIKIFNYGKMRRDFTYVDDIAEGVKRIIPSPPKGNETWNGFTPDPSSSIAPYKVYNIGNNNPVELMDFVKAIESELGKEAQKELLPIQAGDVPETYADVSDLVNNFDYKPDTSIKEGIRMFIKWYKEFH